MTNVTIINYTTRDFATKEQLELYLIRQEKVYTPEIIKLFTEAGLLRRVVTQIWNKQGKFRLGVYYAYRDEKAFVNCQKILNGIPTDEENPVIQNADRGVVVLHVDMTDE